LIKTAARVLIKEAKAYLGLIRLLGSYPISMDSRVHDLGAPNRASNRSRHLEAMVNGIRITL